MVWCNLITASEIGKLTMNNVCHKVAFLLKQHVNFDKKTCSKSVCIVLTQYFLLF